MVLWQLAGVGVVERLDLPGEGQHLPAVVRQGNGDGVAVLQDQLHAALCVAHGPILAAVAADDENIFFLTGVNAETAAGEHLEVFMDDMVLGQGFQQVQGRRADGAVFIRHGPLPDDRHGIPVEAQVCIGAVFQPIQVRGIDVKITHGHPSFCNSIAHIRQKSYRNRKVSRLFLL